MATPHVAGLAALLKAQDGNRTGPAIRNLLLSSGEVIPSLPGITTTGRRIRAADTNGVGALTCVDQVVAERMKPATDAVRVARGATVQLSFIHINCENVGGDVDVIADPSGDTITLLDDGQGSDAIAGDAIYSGEFVATETGTLTFPNNDVVAVEVVVNYLPPTDPGFQYRVIGDTQLALTDDSSASITSPFPIEYDGTGTQIAATEVYVGSNGWVSFEPPSLALEERYDNEALPQPDVNTLVAPFWDDLNPDEGGGVFWEVQGAEPSRELIIEWRDLPQYIDVGDVTFELVFFEGSSSVLFNYLDVDFGDPAYNNGASATIGVQVAPTVAQQFSFDLASVADATGLLFQLDRPVADAGLDQVVNFDDAVTLDGSASSDPSGPIDSYLWQQLSGEPVNLDGADTATATFAAPQVAGAIGFQLTVTNMDGNSDSDRVEIVVNAPPSADAGTDQRVNFNDAVTLDGTASSDTDGTIVGFAWTQLSGEPVALNNAGTATAGFTAPGAGGTLTFQLTVTDNDGATDTSTVDVSINVPPTSDAGTDQRANFNDAVTLDGTASSDTDGMIVGFAWTQLSGEPVALNNAGTATAGFTAPSVGDTLTFQLTVTDNDGAADSNTVDVSINVPPDANAGADQTVTRGDTVNLNANTSSDSDGIIASYAWAQTSGPVVTMSSASTATPSFAAQTVGTLSFQVVVTDNDSATDTDAVTVTVNKPPSSGGGSVDFGVLSMLALAVWHSGRRRRRRDASEASVVRRVV